MIALQRSFNFLKMMNDFKQGRLVFCVLLIPKGVLGAYAGIKDAKIFYLSYYCSMNKNHSPLHEYVLRDLSQNCSLNVSDELLQMNKNHFLLYEYVFRDLSWNYSLNESDEFLQKLTFKACNTDTYVSLTLLHAVVR